MAPVPGSEKEGVVHRLLEEDAVPAMMSLEDVPWIFKGER